jgi:hypothetical protein
MSEVICPYCGTPNQSDADVCQSCRKPLSARPPGNSGSLDEDLDWLENFRSDNSEPSQEPKSSEEREYPQESEHLEEAEIPEWLERIRKRTMEDRKLHEMQTRQLGDAPPPRTSEPDEEEEFGQVSREDETTPALTSQEDVSQTGADSRQSETLEPPGFTGEDQLADLGGFELPGSEQPETEETPDWLKQLLPEKPEEETELASLEISPEFAGEGEIGAEGKVIAEEAFDLEPSLEFLESPGPEDFKTEFPDWPEETAAESEGEVFLDGSGEILPGFTHGEESDLSGEMDHETIPDESAENEVDQHKEAEALPSSEKAKGEPEIVEARLPGWLEAIRPIESVAPERFSAEADNQTEDHGPLAGFQGVIPAGEAVSRYARPTGHTPKIQVSEKQKVYAGLLENLIAEEARPVEREAEKTPTPSAFLRFLVGLVLVGLLAFLLVNGTQFGPLPGLYPIETVAFFDTAQQLRQLQQPPARILVAVDYEPALSGELQTIAVYPVQQLLESGSQLALISTVPSGAALGQQLVTAAGADIPNFQSDTQVINLGYLVGGNASLASLALQPSMAAPTRLDGNNAWDSPLLQGIHTVADFDGLLLLTDNPETARTWVEQVEVYLGGKPLLVISSAQSAPMILPYYQSEQIQGLLAGLSGSAVYEQLAQRGNSLTRTYWDAYQAGILLVIASLLIGGLYYGIQALFQSQRSRKRT